MTERHSSPPDRPEGGRYEIRLTGHLDARWTTWFDGLAVRQESDGTTVLSGLIVDQAALHGLLQRVRDLGLPLVSIGQVATERPNQQPMTLDPSSTHEKETNDVT